MNTKKNPMWIFALACACILIVSGCSKDKSDLQAVSVYKDKPKHPAAPITAVVVPNGTYLFMTQVTIATPPNKYVGVSGLSSEDQALIEQRDYDGMAREWTVTNVGGNEYSITSVISGKALTLLYGQTAEDTYLVQWPYSGSTTQRWIIEYQALGAYRIKSVATAGAKGMHVKLTSGGASDPANGASIVLKTFGSTGALQQSGYFQLHPVPVRPFLPSISGARFQIFNPDQGGVDWYINDHTFVKKVGTTSEWHMFGIQRAEASGQENTFAHAVSITGLNGTSWTRRPDITRYTGAPWNENGSIWAPHVIESGGTYYMFYCSSIDGVSNKKKMQVRTNLDANLNTWSAPTTLFEDAYIARDPCVLRIGSEWVIYYCANKSPSATSFADNIVAYRKSTSLTSGFTTRYIAFEEDPWMTNPADKLTESPFVVQRGSDYYLFVCRGGYPNNWYFDKTDVYKSTDPFNFTALSKQVSVIEAHASEIMQADNGTWYSSHCGSQQQGLWLQPLQW